MAAGARWSRRRSPHDAAETDPERGWSLRRVFRCTVCNDVVTLTRDRDAGAPDAG